MSVKTNLGPVTAYADAKAQGYTGTREQFGKDQAEAAKNAAEVAENAARVADNLAASVQVLKSVTAEGSAQVRAVQTEGSTQVQTVKAEGATQVQAVKAEGSTQVRAVQTEGSTQVQAVKAEGSAQVQAVKAEGSAQVRAVQTEGSTQVQAVKNQEAASVKAVETREAAALEAVEAKKNAVLEEIPSEYTSLVAKVGATAIINEAAGELITLKDSADQPLQNLKLYGKSTQNGTPTPDNPVAIESAGDGGSVEVNIHGKNLIEYPYITTAPENNGVTFTVNADRSITINGTATNYASFRLADDRTLSKKLKVGTKYYINQPYDNPTASSFSCFLNVTDTVQNKALYLTNAFVWKEEYVFNYLYIQVNPTVTVNNYTFYPLLEVGGAPSAYEQPATSDTKQTLTHSTPNGLRGIPVISGGNYTDENGQEWICDEVDFERGVYIQRTGGALYDGSSDEAWGIKNKQTFAIWNNSVKKAPSSTTVGAVLCDKLTPTTHSNMYASVLDNSIGIQNDGNAISIRFNSAINTLELLRAKLSESPITVYYALETPIEMPLSAEELGAFKALKTLYPCTTILNSDNAGMAVAYHADTKLYIDNKFAELSAAILNS